MKKKALKILLYLATVITVFTLVFVSASAKNADKDLIEDMKALFAYGVGPETDGYTIDYRYYSPVKEDDSTKYPLVVWIHGLGDGKTEGKQIAENDIARWASPEFQSRFEKGGAFILAPRAPEDKNVNWNDDLIFTLRATIDDFVEKNKGSIDLSRIYIGGYSLGGRTTFKMITAYPEMFAAAFPICPAWMPDSEQAEYIDNIPIWLTSGTKDPLVSYKRMVTPGWERIMAVSLVKEDCRFSTLTKVTYPDGTRTSSSHHSWYAVSNDMFSRTCGDYPHMTTTDGNGSTVTLTYPDGMISWLCQFTSNYDGTKATDKGNLEAESTEDEGEEKLSLCDRVRNFFKALFDKIKALFAR